MEQNARAGYPRPGGAPPRRQGPSPVVGPTAAHIGFGTLLSLMLLATQVVEGTLSRWQVLSVLVVVVMCLLALLVPWRSIPKPVWWLLPTLALLATGLAQLGTEDEHFEVLAVLPAVWLSRQFGWTGAAGAAVGTLLLVTAPALAYYGFSGHTLLLFLMPAVVGLSASLVIAAELAATERAREVAEEGRREVDAALSTLGQERRFTDSVFDTVDVGLLLLDADGSPLAMNQRMRRFLELAYSGGVEPSDTEPIHAFAEDGVTRLEAEEMPAARALRGEEFTGLRLWLGEDPLTRRAVSISARPVTDDSGQQVGGALAATDVTDVVRALRSRDDFLAAVSHELRTPLAAVLGHVELMMQEPQLHPVAAPHLDALQRNALRLRRLVADLLHAAESDYQQAVLLRRPVDLVQLVRECVDNIRSEAERAGLTIEAKLPVRLDAVVDADRIGQVIDNLLSNAVKYTPAGGAVAVTLERDGPRAELVIADTGTGISPGDRERLFTRYFRARPARQGSASGVGLGLTIAQLIVDSHGGRIEVESEPGAGATFTVRLPLESGVAAPS